MKRDTTYLMKVFSLLSLIRNLVNFLLARISKHSSPCMAIKPLLALYPYGCGVFVSFAKRFYQSLESDETKCSTLFCFCRPWSRREKIKVIMETSKRQDYVIPEAEMIQMVENSILCISGGKNEGFDEGEI